jgi:secreted protein with Ig-like and vWFA domain
MIDPTKAILDWEQADQILQDQRAEIARLRLTATERGAVERAAAWLAKAAESRKEIHSAGYLCDDAAVLRSVLERL